MDDQPTDIEEEIEEPPVPLEVKVVNQNKPEKSIYDSKDSDEYDEIKMSIEDIEKFEEENGNT